MLDILQSMWGNLWVKIAVGVLVVGAGLALFGVNIGIGVAAVAAAAFALLVTFAQERLHPAAPPVKPPVKGGGVSSQPPAAK